MKQKKEGLDMLSSHLRAALIGYDEVCQFLLKCN